MNPVIAEISRSALRHNLNVVRRFAGGSKVLTMIKANGYGHDAIEVANVFSEPNTGADALGVARINEALMLKNAGIEKPIVLMEGCFNLDELTVASKNNFEIVIHNHQQLEQLLFAQLIRPVSVWLKLDTGMNRIGFETDETKAIIEQLESSTNVNTPITCLTHFACADQITNSKAEEQLVRFMTATQDVNCLRSCANSAAIVSKPTSHYDWVRPGIMLYGSSPIYGELYSKYDLQPVMSLQSIVIAVNNVNKGESVGYGARWIAEKNTSVAVVAIGYGDGYPRNAKDGTPVMINGKTYPLVGRVSMDMITVDVGNASGIKMGDSVTLWGTDKCSGNVLPAETVATYAETISYEMFCNLASRVEKRFIE